MSGGWGETAKDGYRLAPPAKQVRGNTMELRALWKIVRRRWWLIALPALAALAFATYGYLKAPPRAGFTTQIRYTAAQAPGKISGLFGYEDSHYYPWLASEYVINGLTDWVRTSSFAEEISAALAAQEIDIPAGAIQGGIAADNERSVMVLYLSWHDAGQLEAIARAATTVLQERSAEYFPQFGTRGVDVVVLDEPVIAPVPPPISVRFEPLVRFGLGLAAGVALAFLVEYLDPTVHRRAEVEELGLPVLAEIPRD